MIDFIWIAVVLPLLGAATLLLFGKRIGEPRAGYLATALAAGSFLVVLIAAGTFFAGGSVGEQVYLFTWIPGLGINAEFLWDPLSAVMTLVVAGVGSLIHLYSIGYMHGDEHYSRFFAYLNLFLASMLILVLGANFAVLFVGWELVGLCSYLLISFWFEKPSAAAAGKKAFIVNRIGDFGFVVALMLIFATFGTLGFSTVFERAGSVLESGGVTVTVITLLLLVGATGKSAQLPLYVWLPDAMEGPTPVSALIHAATMVTAGVYMVARTGALFELAPFSAGVVATVGAITALYAATIAIGQKDIKRVLAYSTISQLGYMFMGVGVAAYTAGIFHLMTHAFFKALLFLGAGSVIHAMSGEQNMDKMGGLRKAMPKTFATMAIAWLAISGIPPFAGFWSKDEILGATFNKGGYFVVLWAIGLITAGLTAYYMSRLMFRTFYGESRWDKGVHPHESPGTMTIPLIALGTLAAVGGLINTPWRLTLEHFLDPAFENVQLAHTPDGATPWILALVSVAAAAAGIYYAYKRFLVGEAPEEKTGIWETLLHGYYVDDLYGKTLVLPGKELANQMAFTADAKGIDAAVNGVGGLVKRIATLAKPLQTGFVRSYGVGILGGAAALVLIILMRGAW
jgi:NADH-quinone oxidoreductase subunit L